MANFRMEDDLGRLIEKTLEKEFKRITNDIEEDVMSAVAEEIETIMRREMRLSGVDRSEKTGTHHKRSADEKQGYRKWGGSILNTGNRVAASADSNEVVAYGGVPSGRDYVARFLDQGTERRMAWHYKNEQRGNQRPLGFREKASKVVKSQARAMTKKGIEKACKRVRSTTVKRVYK